MVVSRKLHPEGTALVFGNQLLAEQVPDYPPGDGSRFIRTPQHTVEAVSRALGDDTVALPATWSPPCAITSAAEVFGGYLLLDAWIANTDRHHLNWGVVEIRGARFLAPTYDHAASLGAGLTDDERRRRLDSRDRQYTVAAYVSRSQVRSALFRDADDARPLSPLAAFEEWTRRWPAAIEWVRLLEAFDDGVLAEQIARMPDSRMSEPARRFVLEMLRCNKRRILEASRS